MHVPAWLSPVSVLLIIGLVVAAHVVYFRILPLRAVRRGPSGPRLCRYLQRVVATPSLLGDAIRLRARDALMQEYLRDRRYDDAAQEGFAILRHAVFPGLSSGSVRACLADALDGLGRSDDAADQRRLADSDISGVPQNYLACLTRGRLLSARGDFAGACAAYEQGVALAPRAASDTRDLLIALQASTLFRAGRLEDSAKVAEEATRGVRTSRFLLDLHRLAGSCNSALHRLEKAEFHNRRVVALVEGLGDPGKLADALVGLAMLSHQRGNIAEALSACDRAAGMGRATRFVEMLRFDALRSSGRFDEALAALGRAARVDPLAIPREEERMQGVLKYARAATLMQIGRLDEVPALLDSARDAFRDDRKLALWYDAAAIRLAAHQGRREDAVGALESMEARLAEFAQDHTTLTAVLGNLGHASIVLGEYDHALDFWREYLGLPPEPVDVPTAQYFLGEAHRGLGDEQAARSAYRASVDTGLETHYAKLARSRLRSLPGL